jgi:nucleotide-binding universal stress UspA family protein
VGAQSSIPRGLLSILRECSSETLDEIRAVAAQLIEERAATLTVVDVKPRIQAAASALEQEDSRGGILPLDVLRRQLPTVPRPLFDAALLDMEQLGAITLKPAQALRSQRAEHGIRSERGLLFFVIVHEQAPATQSV